MYRSAADARCRHQQTEVRQLAARSVMPTDEPFVMWSENSMTGVVARSVAAGVAAIAGVAAGFITNKLTDAWTWTWGIGLGVTVVILVASQVVLTLSNSGNDVRASGRGAIAAGGSVRGDIDVETDGSSSAPAGHASGVVADGDGVIAAGKSVKGKIRIRSIER